MPNGAQRTFDYTRETNGSDGNFTAESNGPHESKGVSLSVLCRRLPPRRPRKTCTQYMRGGTPINSTVSVDFQVLYYCITSSLPNHANGFV